MSPSTLILAAFKPSPVRVVVAALGIAGAFSGNANAVSLRVKLACATDYYSHCSHHAVGTPGVRQCMRDNGAKLSSRCINALIIAGEVSRAEVEQRRRAAAAARAKAAQTAAAD